MKMFKKGLSVTLAAVLCLGLAACGGGSSSTSESPSASAAEESASADTAASEATTEAATEETSDAATTDAAEATDAASSIVSGDKVNAIKESGQLVMGCSADFPPFEFHIMNDGNDQIVGYDVMLLTEVASNLGVELVVKDMSFDSLVGALNSGTIDAIASGMNINEERKKQVEFSDEYFTGDQVLIVRKDATDSYKTAEDFKGKKIGIQSGSVQENYANDQLVTPYGAEITLLPEIPSIIMQLKTGSIDAVLLDKAIGEAYIRQNSDDLVASAVTITGGDYGFAVAIGKGNTDLVEVTNQTLAQLKEEGKLDTFMDDAMKLASTNETN